MELNERVRALEVQQKELRADVAEIKLQVMNHIPTQIEKIQEAVDAIATQHVQERAVKVAWDKSMMKLGMILGVIWTFTNMLRLAVEYVK